MGLRGAPCTPSNRTLHTVSQSAGRRRWLPQGLLSLRGREAGLWQTIPDPSLPRWEILGGFPPRVELLSPYLLNEHDSAHVTRYQWGLTGKPLLVSRSLPAVSTRNSSRVGQKEHPSPAQGGRGRSLYTQERYHSLSHPQPPAWL